MELGFIIVVILLILAMIDLTVGVSNDAVNFINCAYGSNAAKLRTILIIGAVGVLVGVLSSGGMLEVARKGVFYPQQFSLMELLMLFLSVMFADIILLDIFNSYGLPTSTTVSIVFDLIGAAFATFVIKTWNSDITFAAIDQYFNLQNIVFIIVGIFLSIVIAFIAGSIIQYLTRLIFTFDYKRRFKKYGAIWCSIVVTVLSAFIVFKGAKHATFIPAEANIWMKEHLWTFLGIMFVIWYVVLQLLISFTKVNVLKGIVLFGTFALAMAFAANDLVNFIGAPIAGLTAYDLADGAIGNGNPFSSLMNGDLGASMELMKGKVDANVFILLISAAIMIITLFVSRKAMGVVKTGISLGSQSDVDEKFDSNMLGRFMVRVSIDTFGMINKIVPESLASWVRGRFDLSKYQPELDDDGNEPAFDLIRATVVLFVAAALIIVATSMKLPLSTTYVTFITAMAAALPDKAWGRDSAVYRVSGVLTVIGGWFFTAFFAATFAFLVCLFINWGGIYAITVMVMLIGFLLYRSTKKAKADALKAEEKAKRQVAENATKEGALCLFLTNISDFLDMTQKSLTNSITGLANSKHDKLNKAHKNAKKTQAMADDLKSQIMKMLYTYEEVDPKINLIHSKEMIIIQDIVDRCIKITKNNFKYVDNNHHELIDVQISELEDVNGKIAEIMDNVSDIIRRRMFDSDDKLKADIKSLRRMIKDYNKNQIARQMGEKTRVRRSMLYMNLLFEIKVLFEDLYEIYYNSKKVYKQNIRFNKPEDM